MSLLDGTLTELTGEGRVFLANWQLDGDPPMNHKGRVLGLVLLLAMPGPTLAQITPPGTAHIDVSVVGLPIYTSDGVRIGEVSMLGTYRGEIAMVGEVARTMGLGTRTVLIPTSMATVAADRVVLSITSDQINKRLEAAH